MLLLAFAFGCLREVLYIVAVLSVEPQTVFQSVASDHFGIDIRCETPSMHGRRLGPPCGAFCS